MSFQAYSVAVRLTLVNQVSSGLVALAGQFAGLNRHITTTQGGLSAIQQQLQKLKAMGLAGGALAAVGGFGLAAFKGPLEAASQYELAYTRFKTLNLGEVVNRQADEFARGTQAFGASSAQLMETLRGTYSFFGDINVAKKAAVMVAELNASNALLFNGKVGALDDSGVRSLKKFADMRGATNDFAGLKSSANIAQKLFTGSGGDIKFSDLEQFGKVGGTAFRALSDEGIVALSSILQEQGGSRTGNMVMSGFQNIVSGRSTKRAQAALAELGLGSIVQQAIGTVNGKVQTRNHFEANDDFRRAYQEHPVLAMQRFILPAIEKKYGKDADNSIIFKVINDLFSNRSGSNLNAAIATQLVQVLRDWKMTDRAMGIDETNKAAKGTVAGQFNDLSAKWKNVMVELGVTVLPIAIRAAQGLSNALKSIATFAQQNPTFTRGMVTLFGVMAAAATAGGAIILAKTAFQGLSLVLGVGSAAGGALSVAGAAALAATRLGVLSAGLYAFYNVSKLFDGLKGLYDLSKHEGVKLAPDAQRRIANGDLVRPGAERIVLRTQINLDGRKIGEAVSKHQGKEAARPALGSGMFDMGVAPLPAGVGFSGS